MAQVNEGHEEHEGHGGHAAVRKHEHEHSNGRGRGHSHGGTQGHGRAFVIAIALNSIFVVVEFTSGFVANSTALMADAGHNLSDVLGLLLAWGAVILARRKPDERYTYGLRSSSILAALGNAILLLLACGAIAWEALARFSQPPVVAGLTVTLVATVGIVINGLSAWLFARGSKGDINIRGAYLHMAGDAAVSLGVLISGLVMISTGWYWLDPAVSLAIVVVIVLGTWGLLRQAVQLALNAVPENIDASAVADYLRQCVGVAGIHDLHIWGMSTTESALTAHLVMPQGYPGDAFVDDIAHTLNKRFGIAHSTLQVEQGAGDHACALHSALEGVSAVSTAHRH